MKEQDDEEHAFTQVDDQGNAVGDKKEYEQMINNDP